MISMINCSTILCVSDELLSAIGASSIPYWLYNLVARIHDAIAIKENSEQNLHIWPNLTWFFWSWLFWTLSLGWSVFGFHEWPPVMSFLSKSGSPLNVVNISWVMLKRLCVCSKFSNFGTIFAAARFMPKTSVKFAWHEPNDMPTSSTTSLIVIRNHFLHCFNVFFGCWHLLGLP